MKTEAILVGVAGIFVIVIGIYLAFAKPTTVSEPMSQAPTYSKSPGSSIVVSGPSSLRAGQQGTWKIIAPSWATDFAVIWGDGTPIKLGEGSGIPRENEFSSNSAVVHTFSKIGSHHLTFFVKGPDGKVDAVGLTVTVFAES